MPKYTGMVHSDQCDHLVIMWPLVVSIIIGHFVFYLVIKMIITYRDWCLGSGPDLIDHYQNTRLYPDTGITLDTTFNDTNKCNYELAMDLLYNELLFP